MKEGLIYVPFEIVAEKTETINTDFKPRKLLSYTQIFGIFNWERVSYNLEDTKVISMDDVDWMEADEWGEGYWYFKYTGKLLNKDQIKELGL